MQVNLRDSGETPYVIYIYTSNQMIMSKNKLRNRDRDVGNYRHEAVCGESKMRIAIPTTRSHNHFARREEKDK